MANQFAADYNKRVSGHEDSPALAYFQYTALTGALPGIGDKVYFGVLPGGIDITNVSLICDACTALATLSLGYEIYDPNLVNAALTPAAANNAAWFNAQAISTAGRFEYNSHPLAVKRDIIIVGTLAGAALTANNKLSVVIGGLFVGKP